MRMRLPELLCDHCLSATARRNNVHSVGCPECGALQLVSLCSFLAESRMYRRLGCGRYVWMVRRGSFASSRIAACCLVWSRLVSFRPGCWSRDSYGREWSNGGRGRRTDTAIPVQGTRRLYGDGCRSGRGRAGYAAVVVSSRQRVAIIAVEAYSRSFVCLSRWRAGWLAGYGLGVSTSTSSEGRAGLAGWQDWQGK